MYVEVVGCWASGDSLGRCVGGFNFRPGCPGRRRGNGSHHWHQLPLSMSTWASRWTTPQRPVSSTRRSSASAKHDATSWDHRNTSMPGRYPESPFQPPPSPSSRLLPPTSVWPTVATTRSTTVSKRPITWTPCWHITTPTRKSPAPWRSSKSFRCIGIVHRSLTARTQQFLLPQVHKILHCLAGLLEAVLDRISLAFFQFFFVWAWKPFYT